VQLEVVAPELCAACASMDCVRAEHRHRFDRRSCPSYNRPFERRAADGCVLCFQCAKVCPQGNVGFGLASSTSAVRVPRRLEPFEAAFVGVAVGFVTHELVGEVEWLDHVFHGPVQALARLVPRVGFGWLEALWFLVLFPAALWGLIATAAWLLGGRSSLRESFLASATGAAPVVAVAHLAKAVSKAGSWATYLPLAVHDRSGLDTADKLAAHALQAPGPLLGLSTVGVAVGLLLVVVGWRSWRSVLAAAPTRLAAARTGLAVVAALYSAVLIAWGAS
jgi:ferredoxin